MPMEREKRSEWEGEREDGHKNQIQMNIFFLWKMKGVVEKKKKKKSNKVEEGGPDSEEVMLVWWGPCAGLERRWGAERTLWTRLDDSTPS